MKSAKFLLLVVLFFGFVISGCENLGKNTRQTGKNINALFLDGYQKDLYTSR